MPAKCGIFVLKTDCGFQQHIFQEESILRQITNLEYWKMLLTANSILLIFKKLLKSLENQTDLFATTINKQLDEYVSWHPESETMAISAFSYLIFTPFSLTGGVLAKIHRDKTNAVIVLPDWSTQ